MRDKVFLVSKSGVTWDENMRVRKTNDPVVTKNMLHQSLKDLRTDYIDLFMIHWPDDYYAIENAMQVLVEAQKQGKIRYIGLCNTNLEDLEKASTVGRVDVIQNNYNLFDRSTEKELLPYCQKENVGFMSYGTLDKGIIAGVVSSFGAILWIMLGQYYNTVYKRTMLPTFITECPTIHANSTFMANSTALWRNSSIVNTETDTASYGILDSIYSISYMYYTSLGLCIFIAVASIVSIVTGRTKLEDIDDKLLVCFMQKARSESKSESAAMLETSKC